MAVQVQPAFSKRRLRSGDAGLDALAEGCGFIWPGYPAMVDAVMDDKDHDGVPIVLALAVIGVADCICWVIYKRRIISNPLAAHHAPIMSEHDRTRH